MVCFLKLVGKNSLTVTLIGDKISFNFLKRESISLTPVGFTPVSNIETGFKLVDNVLSNLYLDLFISSSDSKSRNVYPLTSWFLR